MTSHRFRHTSARNWPKMRPHPNDDGDARHTGPARSLFSARISDTTVLRDYQTEPQPGALLAGPAADAIRSNELSEQAVNRPSSNYRKTALELGLCRRLPEDGPCECDLFLTCAKFFTSAE